MDAAKPAEHTYILTWTSSHVVLGFTRAHVRWLLVGNALKTGFALVHFVLRDRGDVPPALLQSKYSMINTMGPRAQAHAPGKPGMLSS